MSTYEELLMTVSEAVRSAIERIVSDAGTSDAAWSVLQSAGERIAVLEHAAGKMLETLRLARLSPDRPGSHIVCFYNDDAETLRIAAERLKASLGEGDGR